MKRSEVGNLPAWLPDESKRDYLNRVFELLRSFDRGRGKILQLAQFLAEQTTFPDLQGWEDTADKLDSAQASVAALKNYLHEQEESMASEQQRQEARKRLRESQARARESQQTLRDTSQ